MSVESWFLNSLIFYRHYLIVHHPPFSLIEREKSKVHVSYCFLPKYYKFISGADAYLQSTFFLDIKDPHVCICFD